MIGPSAFVALPVTAASASVEDALQIAQDHHAEAILVQDQEDFRLVRVDQLAGLASQPGSGLATVASDPLQILGGADAQLLNLGATFSTLPRLNALFPSDDTNPFFVSLFAIGGQDMALALANPNGTFKLVSKVWVCPDGGEKFSSSGKCPTHDVLLVLET